MYYASLASKELFLLKFTNSEHSKSAIYEKIFKLRSSHYSSRNPYDLRQNQVTFGSNSFESVGPQIWDGLPNEVKSTENLKKFMLLIHHWNGPECKCSTCSSFNFIQH